MNKTTKKLGLVGFTIIVLVVVLLSLSTLIVLGQYEAQQTAYVIIPSSGVTHVNQNNTVGGVSIDIAGTPGVILWVSTSVYIENPHPDASIPVNVTLAHFVSIIFNVAETDFQSANITISYSASDVAGISSPYTLYKYNTATNSYTALNSIVNTSAKTITTTITSTTDSLFAVGGTTVSATPFSIPLWAWGVAAAILIIILLILDFLPDRLKKKIFHKNETSPQVI